MKKLLMMLGVVAIVSPAGAVSFTNGDFEGGFTGTSPDQVANGWTSYVSGTTQLAAYRFEQATGNNGYAQLTSRLNVLRSDRGCGIYQQIDVTHGDAFVFDAWVWAAANYGGNYGAYTSLRADWSGGTDPWAADTIKQITHTPKAWTYSGKTGMQAPVTGTLTFFLDIIGSGGNADGRAYWDDVAVRQTYLPEAVSVTGISATTADVDVNLGVNRAETEYAISISGGAYGSYAGIYWVQADGSISGTKDDSVFRTDAAWGTTTLTGLQDMTQYTLQAVARWDVNFRQETALGAPATFDTPEPAAVGLLALGGLMFLRRRR